MSTEPSVEHTTDLPELAEPPEDWRAAVSGPRPGDPAGFPAPARPIDPDPTQSRRPGRPDTGDGDRSWQQRAEAAEQRAAQLQQALASRPGIEQAKGVLMAVFGLDADAAFAVLIRASQHSNTRLAVIADQLVRRAHETGLGPTASERVRGVLDELATARPDTSGSLPGPEQRRAPGRG